MREADIIRQAFTSLLGRPIWKVRKGHGSFLTFDFQVLPAGEPEGAAAQTDPWHLWIYCCQWRLLIGERIAADSNAVGEDITGAAQELTGYCLLDVGSDPSRGTSRFFFERRAVLETWPYPTDTAELWPSDQDQWLLYAPGNRVFTYAADGHAWWQAGAKSEPTT